jgi:hypothetical protein
MKEHFPHLQIVARARTSPTGNDDRGVMQVERAAGVQPSHCPRGAGAAGANADNAVSARRFQVTTIWRCLKMYPTRDQTRSLQWSNKAAQLKPKLPKSVSAAEAKRRSGQLTRHVVLSAHKKPDFYNFWVTFVLFGSAQ